MLIIEIVSKDLFVKTMERLKKFEEKVDRIDVALNSLSLSINNIFIEDPTDMIVKIFQEVFCDTENWLPFFIYDCNWLSEITDGEKTNIKNWENVYDFLKNYYKK